MNKDEFARRIAKTNNAIFQPELDIFNIAEVLWELSERINKLEDKTPKLEEFKVGWVYENGLKNPFLVHHIWKDRRTYSLITSQINMPQLCSPAAAFTLNGFSLVTRPISEYNLILSTGRPYEESEK